MGLRPSCAPTLQTNIIRKKVVKKVIDDPAYVDYYEKQIKEKMIDTESPLELTRSTEESEETDMEEGGPPGTPSNTPGDTIGQSQSSGETSKRTQESRDSTFQPRLTKETVTKVAPGEILSQVVSIAVNQAPKVVDGETTYEPRTPDQMAMLSQQLMTAVAHIQDDTRYQFFLKDYPFDRTAQTQSAAIASSRRFRQTIESVAFVVLPFLILAIFVYVLKRAMTPPPPAEEEEEIFVEPEPKEMSLGQLGLRMLGEGATLPPEEQKSKMMLEQVEMFAKSNPDDVAIILKNWIGE